ncbi:MAG TPA: hypothetical protein VFB33_11505 [Candidatus Binataceae bacterium]|nr:hypothetical protein [Candidatus Binataceae bacterium]
MFQKKVDLVVGAVGTKSLRDYGGLYLVHGRYLLEPAIKLDAEFASMIDVTPRPEFDVNVKAAQQVNPKLKIEFINADFRDPALYERLTKVDTSILYEVLLHQENYVGILNYVAEATSKFICIAQPCLREDTFPLPSTATLLQFWPEELKERYREGSMWPKEPRVERFASRYWMWGHTASHLEACMHGLGWELEAAEAVGEIYGPYWDYLLMRFYRK